MKMEVTEKEAMTIYSARYLEKDRKRHSAISYIYLAVVFIVAVLALKAAGAWAGVGAMVLMFVLFSIFSSKRARKSQEYAKGQISGDSDTP